MFRKFVAINLFVSLIAMSTSGLMMFFVERPSFTIQMHPVHKLFGLVMVVSAALHLALNWKSIRLYLRSRKIASTGAVLTIALAVLYGLAFTNPLPTDVAQTMDTAASHTKK